MDELIDRLVSNIELDRNAAEKLSPSFWNS